MLSHFKNNVLQQPGKVSKSWRGLAGGVVLEDPASGWVSAHRVGVCQPCDCDAASASEMREHTGCQSASSAKFLAATWAEISGASGEKMLKLLAKWSIKPPSGDRSQEGGYPDDGGGAIYGKRHEGIFWWLQGEYLDEKSLPSSLTFQFVHSTGYNYISMHSSTVQSAGGDDPSSFYLMHA